MESNFFKTNTYFIDEKVNFLKFENTYHVYNENGEMIGGIFQKLSVGEKILRLLINKAMMPFKLEIRNQNGDLEASVNRGWTFFMSKITITDGQGLPVGIIRQKFKLFKPTFKIMNIVEQQIGEISGDWKAWNFQIKDGNGAGIGTISKKWNGIAKEMFTTADKYIVHMDANATDDKVKSIILSAAITIDMVLKESK